MSWCQTLKRGLGGVFLVVLVLGGCRLETDLGSIDVSDDANITFLTLNRTSSEFVGKPLAPEEKVFLTSLYALPEANLLLQAWTYDELGEPRAPSQLAFFRDDEFLEKHTSCVPGQGSTPTICPLRANSNGSAELPTLNEGEDPVSFYVMVSPDLRREAEVIAPYQAADLGTDSSLNTVLPGGSARYVIETLPGSEVLGYTVGLRYLEGVDPARWVDVRDGGSTVESDAEVHQAVLPQMSCTQGEVIVRRGKQTPTDKGRLYLLNHYTCQTSEELDLEGEPWPEDTRLARIAVEVHNRNPVNAVQFKLNLRERTGSEGSGTENDLRLLVPHEPQEAHRGSVAAAASASKPGTSYYRIEGLLAGEGHRLRLRSLYAGDTLEGLRPVFLDVLDQPLKGTHCTKLEVAEDENPTLECTFDIAYTEAGAVNVDAVNSGKRSHQYLVDYRMPKPNLVNVLAGGEVNVPRGGAAYLEARGLEDAIGTFYRVTFEGQTNSSVTGIDLEVAFVPGLRETSCRSTEATPEVAASLACVFLVSGESQWLQLKNAGERDLQMDVSFEAVSAPQSSPVVTEERVIEAAETSGETTTLALSLATEEVLDVELQNLDGDAEATRVYHLRLVSVVTTDPLAGLSVEVQVAEHLVSSSCEAVVPTEELPQAASVACQIEVAAGTTDETASVRLSSAADSSGHGLVLTLTTP